MYKLLTINSAIHNTTFNFILRIEDNVSIPTDPANTDYQAYLAWVAEGNTPLPAESN